MQTKSSNYATIFENPKHYAETEIIIGDNIFHHSDIESLSISQSLFGDEYSIGGTVIGQMNLTLCKAPFSCTIPAGRVKGDVNGDGAWTNDTESTSPYSDYQMVMRHIIETELITDPIAFWCADTNDDDRININDAMNISSLVQHSMGSEISELMSDYYNKWNFISDIWRWYTDVDGHRIYKSFPPITSQSYSFDLPSAVPKMSKVEIWTRITDGTNYSNWLPKGIFYTRKPDYNTETQELSVIGYDEMFRTEVIPFATGSTVTAFVNPSLRQVAQHIVEGTDVSGVISSNWDGIDLTIDNASDISDTLKMSAIPYGYTVREILADIATACGGNWTIAFSDTGTEYQRIQTAKLRLVKGNSIPAETSLLINENGYRIKFGEDRIIV